MVISSRTPEGEPNGCPVCGHDFCLEPSWPARDAPCPACGHLVWFSATFQTPWGDMRSMLLELGEARFGPPPDKVLAALKSLNTMEELHSMLRRLITAPSWVEALSGG